MHSTNIIRQVDDLGRIVIPKVLRKRFNIQENDSIEFFVDKNSIILVKHPVNETNRQI